MTARGNRPPPGSTSTSTSTSASIPIRPPAPARAPRRRPWGPHYSLRWRLLASLLLAISVFWGLWFARQMVITADQQTGLWDASMRATAQQIMLSLPRNVGRVGNDGYLALPPRVEAPGRRDEADYQIWERGGRLLLRSAGAPDQPWTALRWDVADQFQRVEVGGARWRLYALNDASGRIQVQVGLSQRRTDADLQDWLRRSLAVALTLIALLATVVAIVVRRSLRPVSDLGALLAARAPFDVRALPAQGLPAEIVPLVDGVNALLLRLDAALQAERRFIGDAAHELRTPLAALMTQAQLAQSATSLAQSQAALGPLIGGIQRSARLVEQLLDMARADAGADARDRLGVLPLHEITAMVVHEFGSAAQAAQQRLALHAEPCHVRADVDAIGVLLRNLLDNALRYSGPGARIEVDCRVVAHGLERRAALSVRDNGRGVPTTAYARLADRFYRVPGTPGAGSGIGLSLVARIAERHGAAPLIEAGLDGRGLGVTVWLALEDDARPAPGAHP